MSQDHVRYELADGVATVCMDDGKVNALSPALVAALGAAVARAEGEARALVLAGRPGRFSGGFDLAVMGESPEAAGALVTAGAELALRLYGCPCPVVAACTGHAIAMGAVLLLAADVRLGAEGDFKIGLNEVAIRLTLPAFATELARDRLSRRHLTRATLLAELYPPAAAVDAGYLDRLAPLDAVVAEARAEARRLAELAPQAFAGTRRRLRGETIARVRATLAEDMRRVVGGE
jgi:enoyl-CoA hydratase